MENLITTAELVAFLRAEGFRISRARLGYLVESNRVCAPAKFAGRAVWSVDLVQRVRHVLRDLDGQPGNFAVKR